MRTAAPFRRQEPDTDLATEAEAVLNLIECFEDGHIQIASSDVLLFELSRIEISTRRTYCLNLLANSTSFIELTDSIEQRAKRYSQTGIKTLDALHLASAVEGNVDHFCSCDDRLLKKAREVDTGLTKVISVLGFIQEVKK
ncbi:MAG: PIN domain-containing protein [Verrucomicrobiota bacterium]